VQRDESTGPPGSGSSSAPGSPRCYRASRPSQARPPSFVFRVGARLLTRADLAAIRIVLTTGDGKFAAEIAQ
jgi:hypothetical protein